MTATLRPPPWAKRGVKNLGASLPWCQDSSSQEHQNPLLPLLGNQNPQREQGAFEGSGSSNSVPAAAAAAVVGWLTYNMGKQGRG